jgi:hypothetical protein
MKEKQRGVDGVPFLPLRLDMEQ